MTTTLLDVDVDKITPNPANPRNHVGDVTELADSIRALGILEPLVIAPGNVLIAGHRRLAAARAAGLTTVPALLRDDLDTPARQIEAMLVENVQRTDLTVMEEAHAYQALLDFDGYTPAKVAKATGRGLKTVKGRIKLTKLPTAATERLDSGEISLADAETLLTFLDDPEAYKKVAAALGTRDFRWVVENLRATMKRRAQHAKDVKALTDAGITVVPCPPWDKRNGATHVGNLYNADGGYLFADDAAHAAVCEHHVVWEGPGSLDGVCTKPDSHPEHIAYLGRTDSDIGEDDEPIERTPDPVSREDLETAANVRRQWIRDNVLGPKASPDVTTLVRLLRRAATTLATEWGRGEDMVELCDGLNPDVDVDEQVTALVASVETADLTRLVQLIAAAEADLRGPGTLSPGAGHPSPDRTPAKSRRGGIC